MRDRCNSLLNIKFITGRVIMKSVHVESWKGFKLFIEVCTCTCISHQGSMTGVVGWRNHTNVFSFSKPFWDFFSLSNVSPTANYLFVYWFIYYFILKHVESGAFIGDFFFIEHKLKVINPILNCFCCN